MKKLKKILLINWLYFSKELIEVGDINFLTGKNGAGKSTVIDALQIVLLGETNSRNFNQAANEKSQRTLEGYLRADMDDNSPYSRRGKDFSTYIVCEFQDEMEGSNFVTGVTFDCRSDGSYRDTFFIYTGTLPENCFIEQGEAMEISALRRFLKQNYARAEFYDTQKEYRRNMLAKWNVHNEQVLRMMKKAVSFRPIVDIQKFITENICDIPDKPNIELMQQNIRDYKRHELLAQRQQEKLDALQQISRLYQEMNQAIDRCQIQKFLVRWAKKEAAQTEIDQRELERTECKENLANVNEQREELERQIEQKETRRSELELACRQSNVFQEEERLLNMEKALRDEQKKLEQGHRVCKILKWRLSGKHGVCRDSVGRYKNWNRKNFSYRCRKRRTLRRKHMLYLLVTRRDCLPGLWSCLKRGSRQRPNCRMLSAVRLIKQRIVLQS